MNLPTKKCFPPNIHGLTITLSFPELGGIGIGITTIRILIINTVVVCESAPLLYAYVHKSTRL